jgi:hypothetical protein
MALRKFHVNRDASSLPCPSLAGNLQFSNRKLPLLESHLGHSKQCIAIKSNRKFSRPWLS